MPANFDTQFAQWLTQHGEVRAQGVNVLEFYHPAFGTHWVSDYGDVFAARTEDAVQFIANPLGFIVDLAADAVTTEQRILIRMDNANGVVMDQFRALDEDDLQNPVRVTYRAYMDTQRNYPMTDPLQMWVTNVTASRLAVELEASMAAMPNITAGYRYTLERFPTLAYL